VSASDAAALHERSGGNPFYLQQLARSPRLAAAGSDGAGVALAGVELPRAVADALTGELALLPDDARRLLQGAAVAGDPFESELASVAAELNDAAALDALDELLRRDLVRDTLVPRRFRFRHPLVRRVVYDAAPGGWKLGAHERCAALLAARGAPAIERANHVERSARHGDGAAVAVLRDAGDASAGRAPATAAALYGAALRLLGPQAPERAALLVALGSAHSAAGQLPEAHAAMLETLALIPADDVTARIEQLAACAGIENWLGLYDQANAHLTAALAELADETSHAAVALMMQLATDRIFAADYDSALQWAQRCLEAARPHGDRARTASAALLVAFAGAAKGSTAEAASACTEAAAIVDEIDDGALARTLFAATPLAIAELALDRPEAAARHAERGLSAARSSGQDRMLPLLYWVATTRRARGRLVEAAELFDAAIEFGHVSGISQGLGVNMLGHSLTATAAGDTEAALAFAEEGAALLSSETSFAGAVSGLARAAALLSAGDPAHAVEALLTASGGDELQRLPAFWRAEGFELLTRCWLALGRREEAARAAVAAEAFADALAVRGARMHAERAAAAVALDSGDAGAAADRALAAAAAADDAGAPVEAALARMLAARALTAAGERDRAAAELARAAEAFDRCAAPRRRAAAERELRRLGRRGVQRRSRAGKSDGGGLESLTERELQIARMIVDRRTNREIAGELFLSLKTVETHVRNLFHKLGVSSRVEVARAVERADREARAPAG
jgi:ATP/maltotriose-dependent transcriptional regulator MalT